MSDNRAWCDDPAVLQMLRLYAEGASLDKLTMVTPFNRTQIPTLMRLAIGDWLDRRKPVPAEVVPFVAGELPPAPPPADETKRTDPESIAFKRTTSLRSRVIAETTPGSEIDRTRITTAPEEQDRQANNDEAAAECDDPLDPENDPTGLRKRLAEVIRRPVRKRT